MKDLNDLNDDLFCCYADNLFAFSDRLDEAAAAAADDDANSKKRGE